jgi:hypothetical protein
MTDTTEVTAERPAAKRQRPKLSKDMTIFDMLLGGDGTGRELTRFLASYLKKDGTFADRPVGDPDGGRFTLDDVFFDLRTRTGKRVVRESIRNFYDRLELKSGTGAATRAADRTPADDQTSHDLGEQVSPGILCPETVERDV